MDWPTHVAIKCCMPHNDDFKLAPLVQFNKLFAPTSLPEHVADRNLKAGFRWIKIIRTEVLVLWSGELRIGYFWAGDLGDLWHQSTGIDGHAVDLELCAFAASSAIITSMHYTGWNSVIHFAHRGLGATISHVYSPDCFLLRLSDKGHRESRGRVH